MKSHFFIIEKHMKYFLMIGALEGNGTNAYIACMCVQLVSHASF